jgi:hypothetical protein
VILVTPDPTRCGPHLPAVPEAASLPAALVGRLDLLERIAELAREHLELPEDTDTAGRLADLLAAAGYPLGEGSHDGPPQAIETVAGTREEVAA